MSQSVSGLYKGNFLHSTKNRVGRTELELRVDVDGTSSLNVVSGDFYEKSNSTRKYLSSFRFEVMKKIEKRSDKIVLIGQKGKFSSNSSQFKDIRIGISSNSNPLKATFVGTSSSKSKIHCICKHVSKYFRTVFLEHDYEEGVVPMEPYFPENLPSPNRSYPISIIDAFADAGIEIIVVNEKINSVPSPKGTPIHKGVWTNDELSEALPKNFTLFKNEPQWSLWLFSAKEYVMSNIFGITINCKGRKRRGCAVFQNSTGWQTDEEKRLRLFIYIHELGHCFNLNHSWEKPQTDQSSKRERYSSLSWMNLPWRYYSSKESSGRKAFWGAFDFQFDSSELMHLRHGFRNDVIFGGNSFNRRTNKNM